MTAFDRSDLLPHWEPTLAGDKRAAKLAAWQAHRACADCRHWYVDPGEDVGGCGRVTLAFMAAPADHSCAEWEPAT
jgi:hypothetical protein